MVNSSLFSTVGQHTVALLKGQSIQRSTKRRQLRSIRMKNQRKTHRLAESALTPKRAEAFQHETPDVRAPCQRLRARTHWRTYVRMAQHGVAQ